MADYKKAGDRDNKVPERKKKTLQQTSYLRTTNASEHTHYCVNRENTTTDIKVFSVKAAAE